MTTIAVPANRATRFGLAFVRTHFPTAVLMAAAAISLLLLEWDHMENWERVAYGVFIVLCIHQLEEYRFPGGFVWGLNMVLGSESRQNYPGNSLSATIVDVSATVVGGIWLFIWPTPSLAAVFVIFAAFEVVAHIYFGIVSYLRYRHVGKTTVYFPGNLTAFLGFAPLTIVGFAALLSPGLLTGAEWWLVGVYFIAYMAVGIALPMALTTRVDSPFVYPTLPAEGYYLHKYEDLVVGAGAGGSVMRSS